MLQPKAPVSAAFGRRVDCMKAPCLGDVLRVAAAFLASLFPEFKRRRNPRTVHPAIMRLENLKGYSSRARAIAEMTQLEKVF